MEVTCLVCREEYWTGSREPLVLPCGHTFCRQCIVCLAQNRNVGCPTCRRKYYSINVDKLLKNFALLDVAMNQNGKNTCLQHGDPVRFWCTECEEEGCGECMFNSHPKQQHHVVHIEARVSEIKKSLQDQANQLILTAKQEMTKRESSFRSYEVSLLRLIRENGELYGWGKKLGDILLEVDAITDIVKLNSVKETMKTLSEEMHRKLSICTENDCETSASECSNNSRSCERAATSVMMDPPGMHVSMFGGRDWRLVWQDGRLLLYPQPHRRQQQHPVQLVAVEYLVSTERAEVFLELSVGQTVLGRVFIHLWSHLRRAQHFLALCLGTLGPSFLGAKLLEVTHRNHPAESVTCGDYITSHGTHSSVALMTRLEWGGEYSGERQEGLLVASSGGIQELDSRFAISTSRRARGQVHCPFGQVVFGMEVMRKTLSYNPVGQVRISSCGLVMKSGL